MCNVLTHARTKSHAQPKVLQERFGIATRRVAYMANQVQVAHNSHHATTLSRTSTLLGQMRETEGVREEALTDGWPFVCGYARVCVRVSCMRAFVLHATCERRCVTCTHEYVRAQRHTHTHTHTHTQNLNLVEHERLGDRTTTTRATTCTDPSAHPRCKRAKYLSGRYV
jgi:hypothetical protein